MERIPMSEKDLKRLEVLKKVKSGHSKQVSASRILGISTRQTRRLLRRLELEGPKGVISKKVGAVGNHKLSLENTEAVLDFCRHPEHYDFGPTLTQEYLLGVSVGRELKILSYVGAGSRN